MKKKFSMLIESLYEVGMSGISIKCKYLIYIFLWFIQWEWACNIRKRQISWFCDFIYLLLLVWDKYFIRLFRMAAGVAWHMKKNFPKSLTIFPTHRQHAHVFQFPTIHITCEFFNKQQFFFVLLCSIIYLFFLGTTVCSAHNVCR